MVTVPTTSTPVPLGPDAGKSLGKVFPLHLAPIDAFFCMDDRPGFPMMSVICLDFRGEADREALEEGLRTALDRHPLLGAHVQPGKRGLPCWVPAENPMPPIDWAAEGTPIRVEGDGGFDLHRETGLRLWVRVGENRTQMTMQVHHACTDGTGVYRFLGDVLAGYTAQVAPETGPPELSPLTPALLRKRRVKMAHVAVRESGWRFTLHGLRQALNLFGRRIRPLATPRQKPIDAADRDTSQPAKSSPERSSPPKSPPTSPFPGIHSVTFSKEEHKQLREAASRHGAMLNDLLLAEMFRAVYIWNTRHGRRTPRGWLRILMPFDMREKEDFEMPAANMTAYTFLTRRARDCQSLDALLRGLREETARIKGSRLGSAFIDAIMLAEFAPRLLQYLLARNRCIATTILSNIGDPSKRFTARIARSKGKVQAGNLILESVTGVPPLRPMSHATLAIFSYARELAVSIRCNPACFDDASAQEFLEVYAGLLRSHLPDAA